MWNKLNELLRPLIHVEVIPAVHASTIGILFLIFLCNVTQPEEKLIHEIIFLYKLFFKRSVIMLMIFCHFQSKPSLFIQTKSG